MSKDNGHLEIKVGKRVTKVRKCATRLELAGFASLLGELVQVNEGYQSLRDEFEKMRKDDKADPAKRIEAFDSVASLDQKFRERTAPLFRKILTELGNHHVSGHSFSEYKMDELAAAAGHFVQVQSLDEGERKN